MDEFPENEHSFDEPTLARLAALAAGFDDVCCVGAPLLGRRLADRGRAVTVLDLDTRCASVPGFQTGGLDGPAKLQARFGLIICDAPFCGVTPSRLFAALRILSHHDPSQPLLLSDLKQRESVTLGTFAPFGLTPTGCRPGYRTAGRAAGHDAEFYSNLPDNRRAALREGTRERASFGPELVPAGL